MSDLALVKKVRETTGAGMVEVQRALTEANDNIEQAIEILRKSGQKIAAKKSERQANEGLLALASMESKVAVVKVTCETDFVARNPEFIQTVQTFADKLLNSEIDEFKVWADQEIKNNLIVKIGENLQLGLAEIITGPIIGSYLHANRKVASIVVLSSGAETVAREIALQVAAMAPQYLRPEDVPAEVIAKEKEIYAEQLSAENKPAEVIDKIIAGKLAKFYSEVCLTKQQFIKDDKVNIENFLAGQNAQIEKFYYFTL